MGLPKLGGWDAFKIMKELHPDMKVVFASGYLDPELKAEILKSGAMILSRSHTIRMRSPNTSLK
jgi:FixJ family two-component response regulator